MLEWDKTGKFRMAALQSSAGERLLRRCGREGDISSIVVVGVKLGVVAEQAP